jgi:S-methylmethionine-dependent homocysteine/selenocysteine methylase
MTPGAHRFGPFLSGGGTLVLDGGLATELERAGFDLDHRL